MADDTPEKTERNNPNIVVFFVGEKPLGPGEFRGHAGTMSNFVLEKIENLRNDWRKIATQVEQMLEPASQRQGAFAIDEVEFALGFSAEGGLHFVAKAGLEAGIKVIWKRTS
jgi:hypothetical protein